VKFKEAINMSYGGNNPFGSLGGLGGGVDLSGLGRGGGGTVPTLIPGGLGEGGEFIPTIVPGAPGGYGGGGGSGGKVDFGPDDYSDDDYDDCSEYGCDSDDDY